ncbi:unnamed protein product, partial [Phaeothamnion confervicola]
MPARQKLLVYLIVLLTFVAFAAWTSADGLNPWWACWSVPIIFVSLWLVMDCMFLDDSQFLFDHDYEAS